MDEITKELSEHKVKALMDDIRISLVDYLNRSIKKGKNEVSHTFPDTNYGIIKVTIKYADSTQQHLNTSFSSISNAAALFPDFPSMLSKENGSFEKQLYDILYGDSISETNSI